MRRCLMVKCWIGSEYMGEITYWPAYRSSNAAGGRGCCPDAGAAKWLSPGWNGLPPLACTEHLRKCWTESLCIFWGFTQPLELDLNWMRLPGVRIESRVGPDTVLAIDLFVTSSSLGESRFICLLAKAFQKESFKPFYNLLSYVIERKVFRDNVYSLCYKHWSKPSRFLQVYAMHLWAML